MVRFKRLYFVEMDMQSTRYVGSPSVKVQEVPSRLLHQFFPMTHIHHPMHPIMAHSPKK